MFAMPKLEIDYRLNVATVASVVLSAVLALGVGLRYVEKQDARISAAERTVAILEVERTRQSLDLQQLALQITRLTVQVDALTRAVERQERDQMRRQ